MAKKKAKAKVSKNDVSDGMACAILSYLLIGIIWFFADDKMKKNKFAGFHAKQGLVLLIGSIVFSVAWGIVFSILAFILAFIPVLGWALILILSLVFYLPLIWVIIGIIAAATGKKKLLPIIGRFGEKFKF